MYYIQLDERILAVFIMSLTYTVNVFQTRNFMPDKHPIYLTSSAFRQIIIRTLTDVSGYK